MSEGVKRPEGRKARYVTAGGKGKRGASVSEQLGDGTTEARVQDERGGEEARGERASEVLLSVSSSAMARPRHESKMSEGVNRPEAGAFQ